MLMKMQEVQCSVHLTNILYFFFDSYGNINPFNFLEGIYTDLHSYTAKIPFDTQGDLINFVRRVELLPRQVSIKNAYLVF